MRIIMDLLLMLGGVAVFLFGMQQMGLGLEQSAGSGVSKLFKTIDKNRFVNYSIGIGTTSIVQSSSATSVMTIGLANANIVNLKQGSGIILGCKVGTTVTAFIIALSGVSRGGFNVSILFAATAFVGVLITIVSNKDSLKKIAVFLVGFGMLFVGLQVMVFAIGGSDSVLSAELTKLFRYEFFHNPFCLILLGTVFTCIIQSSSAASGVFITFLMTGIIDSIDQSFFLIMGANIGTCIDGVLASIGSSTNGKRLALFHVLTSAIGAFTFSIVLVILREPIVGFFNNLFPTDRQWSLATFNLIYNATYTLILLIFLNPFVSLITRIIKEKKDPTLQTFYIDDRLLASPALAVEHAFKEVCNMAEMAYENLNLAFDAVLHSDVGQSAGIAKTEYQIDYITRSLASYFIKLATEPMSIKNERLVGGLHHVINDIERIGDHAVLLIKEAYYVTEHEIVFLDETKAELSEIYAKIAEMYDVSLDTFKGRKIYNLENIHARHQEIVELIKTTSDIHIGRLNSGMYSVEVSKSIYSIFNTLQRVPDHIVNIAFSILSDTGSKAEALAALKEAKG